MKLFKKNHILIVLTHLFLLSLVFLTLKPVTISRANTQNFNKIHSTRVWTIMVYMAADNDLENSGFTDLNEMKIANFDNTTLTVIAELDGWESCGSHSEDVQGYNLTNRYFVPGNNQPLILLESSEKNMGDPTNLRDFIDYSMANYPANYYCLILWNHGLAWETGITNWQDYLDLYPSRNPKPGVFPDRIQITNCKNVCWDDRSFGDSLTELELITALSGLSLDIIAFDACLMGCIETAYAIRNYASYMIASEDSIGLSGFYYEGFLEALQTAYDLAQDYSPQAFSIMIADQTFSRQYSTGNIGETPELAVCDLSFISNLATEIDNLVPYITSMSISNRAYLCQVAESSAEYNLLEQLDIVALANNISTINPSASTAASNVVTALNNAIVWENHLTQYVPSSTGLTIYFPWRKDLWIDAYAQITAFGGQTSWSQVLTSIYNTALDPVDFESISISPINPSESDYIFEYESFFYPVWLYNNEGISLSLTGASGTDFDLYLYDSELSIIDRSEEVYYPETISYTSYGISQLMYIEVYAYSGSGTFTLSASFSSMFARIDFLGCIEMFPSFTPGGSINGLKTVLFFDSPDQSCEFNLSVLNDPFPFILTWTQTFNRGYQTAVISIPCDYLYHFLSGSNPSYQPSSTNWQCFGSLSVKTSFNSYIVGGGSNLTYMIKFSDLDPNLANLVDVSSSYPLIYVDPYGGDPYILTPTSDLPTTTTSSSYQQNYSYFNPYDFLFPLYGLGMLFLIGFVVLKRIRKRKVPERRIYAPPSRTKISYQPQTQQVRTKPTTTYKPPTTSRTVKPGVKAPDLFRFCTKCGGTAVKIAIGIYQCTVCGTKFRWF
ncbi:MAG: clostripain-related cysteine peptidase [Candidatus Hodarchaeota archaeon]